MPKSQFVLVRDDDDFFLRIGPLGPEWGRGRSFRSEAERYPNWRAARRAVQWLNAKYGPYKRLRVEEVD